jgi:hypothetical protein
MLRKLVTILLIFTAFKCAGQDFIVKHKNCKILGLIGERNGEPDLFLTLEEQLKIKNFEINYVTKNHIFKKGDLVLGLEKEILTGMFPPCLIVIQIREEGSEKKFFSAGTKRAFPRQWPAKNYLCKLAVRDVLFHLPYCRKPQKSP